MTLSTAAALAIAAPAVGEDIRDIRAPWAIPAWWRGPLAIALAALVALVVVALVRGWQKRRSRKPTALERAREALRLAETHARAGRSREWADVVAEALRAALAARIGASVLPQTTSELAAAAWARWAYEGPLANAPEQAARDGRLPEAPRIVELLEACDLARFARARMDAESLVAQTALARDLVERLLAPARTTPPTPAEPRRPSRQDGSELVIP